MMATYSIFVNVLHTSVNISLAKYSLLSNVASVPSTNVNCTLGASGLAWIIGLTFNLGLLFNKRSEFTCRRSSRADLVRLSNAIYWRWWCIYKSNDYSIEMAIIWSGKYRITKHHNYEVLNILGLTVKMYIHFPHILYKMWRHIFCYFPRHGLYYIYVLRDKE